MLILGVPLPFDVPVLDRSYYVRLVRGAELDFNFVTALVFVLKQQIQSAGSWLDSLSVAQNEVAEPQNARISRDQPLNPLLIESRMKPERNTLRACEITHVRFPDMRFVMPSVA